MSEMKKQIAADGTIFQHFAGLGGWITELEETIAQIRSLDVSLHEMLSIVAGFASGLQQGLTVVQDGNIVWANEAACRMLGYEVAELIDTSGIRLAHPDYREKLAARMQNIQAGDVLPTYDTWPFLAKNRVVKHIKSYANRIVFNGKPAILAILVDVSEEQKLQDELSTRAEMLELVADFVFMLDMKGKIEYANKAMCEALGYTHDEIMGRSILDFHPAGHKEKIKIRLKLATSASENKYKITYISKNGTAILVSVHGKVIEIGNRQYILAVGRPITHDEKSGLTLLPDSHKP